MAKRKRRKGEPTGKQRRREKARLRFVRTVQDFWSEWEECPLSEDYIKANPEAVERGDRMFWNSRYHVWLRDFHSEAFGATITHLSIKRNDKEPLHDWRDLQRIKNELCGEEREAVELYPAESRIVDLANQYHLWVFPKGLVVPLGFFEGQMKGTPEKAEEIGAKQRRFES